MKGCLLSPILVLLLAANGYAIWQIQLMRGEIAGLREELASQRGEARLSMLDYARDAAEAIGRGEIARARADLERLSEMAQETKQMADQQRRQLAAQIEAARQAVSRGGEDARRKADDLVRLLSHERPKDDPSAR
jgi:signal transduction histidine kinase